MVYFSIEEDDKLNASEESWDVLARRSLLEENSILKKCQETGQCAGIKQRKKTPEQKLVEFILKIILIILDFTIAEFEDKAHAVFLKAIENLKTVKMHHVYLEFCIERLKINSAFLNEEVITKFELK